MPVRVTDLSGQRIVTEMVTVTDGVGMLELGGRERGVSVSLDPDSRVLAAYRASYRGGSTACSAGLSDLDD